MWFIKIPAEFCVSTCFRRSKTTFLDIPIFTTNRKSGLCLKEETIILVLCRTSNRHFLKYSSEMHERVQLVSVLPDAVQHWKMWRHCISGNLRNWLLHAADVQLGHGQTRLVVHASLPTRTSLCCMFGEGNRGVNYCSLAVGLYADYWIVCLVQVRLLGCCILSFVIVFSFVCLVTLRHEIRYPSGWGGICETFSCGGCQLVLSRESSGCVFK